MKHIIDQPLDEFITVLEKSKLLLSLISEAKDFSAKTVTCADVPNQEIINKIQKSIKKSSTNMLILSGTLLLYIVGQFENYIKETMKIVGEQFAYKAQSFDKLPPKMQAHLVFQTTEFIQKPTKFRLQKSDVRSLINQLADSMSETGYIQINKESLVITEQNMRPDILSDLLGRFEIKDIWKDISKQTPIKTFFASEKELEIESQLKELLNNIMEDRNGIAHPSSNPSFPDHDKINKYIAYFEVFAKEFSNIMINKCTVYQPTQSPTF